MKNHLFSLLFFMFLSGAFAQDTLKGTASYYASKFEGRKTANGELFSNSGFTAAHKTLPFGTKVKVINPSNGRSVIVIINDRLPHNSSRTIDLTQKAARELGILKKGIAKVEIILVSDED
jgi:rare lipoprotein A